jgi:NitT/TauT family transport system substrate-binding protein
MRSLRSVLLAVGVVAFLALGGHGMAAERELRKVTFAAASPILTGLCNVTVGQYLGYYAQEGIDPDFLHTEGFSQLIAGLNTGHLQIGMIIPDPVLLGAAQGKPVPVTLAYVLNRGITNGLAVNPDSPIRTTKDLRGKRIGVLSLGHSSYFYPRNILRLEGVDPDKEVEFIAIPGGGGPMGHALRTNQVDAISSFDFAFVGIEGMGFKLRYLPQPDIVEKMAAGLSLGVSREYLRTHKDLVGGFFRAVAKGTVWYRANPEACVRIHWALFPGSRPKGIPEDKALQNAVQQIHVRAPLYSKERGVVPRYGAFSPPDWEAYAKYLGITERIDFSAIYTSEVIEMANDFDERKVAEQARTFDLGKLK